MLEDILYTARDRNREQGITGILMYKDMSFLQILEGEERDVENTIYRITKDPRHKLLIILYNVEIETRDFMSWQMAHRTPKFSAELLSRMRENDFVDYIDDPKGLHHKLSRKAQLLLMTFEKVM